MSIPNEKKACISDGMLCGCADIEAFFLYQMIHGNGERVTTKRHERTENEQTKENKRHYFDEKSKENPVILLGFKHYMV